MKFNIKLTQWAGLNRVRIPADIWSRLDEIINTHTKRFDVLVVSRTADASIAHTMYRFYITNSSSWNFYFLRNGSSTEIYIKNMSATDMSAVCSLNLKYFTMRV